MTDQSPKRRPRLSDRIADHVREEILGGRLAAGEFVRPEAIARELGVSATPAREGLLQLQSEGLLRTEPRRGFRVLGVATADVRDGFVAQALLAGELTARAAHEATAADVRRLRAIQDELETAATRGDLEQVERLNHDFHRAVYAVTEASTLSWLLRSTLRFAPRRYYAEIGGWPESTLTDHHAILQAIAASDPETAREAMKSHIERAGRLLVEELERRSTSD